MLVLNSNKAVNKLIKPIPKINDKKWSMKKFVFTLIILLIPVHILGMRWQFERFHMVILLPEIYLLFEYLRIKKNEAMNIAIIALFILTFMLGMHQYFGHSMNDFI